MKGSSLWVLLLAEIRQASLDGAPGAPWHWQVGHAIGHDVGPGCKQRILAVGAAQDADHEATACVEALLDVSHRVADLDHTPDVLDAEALHEVVDHVWVWPALLHIVGGDPAIDHTVVEVQALDEPCLDVLRVSGVQADLDTRSLQLREVAHEARIYVGNARLRAEVRLIDGVHEDVGDAEDCALHLSVGNAILAGEMLDDGFFFGPMPMMESLVGYLKAAFPHGLLQDLIDQAPFLHRRA